MGTSLSGLTPATTFDALIKVGDNSALSASLKTISDGEGNDSPLKLSTAAVGIGSITNVETEINGKQATLVSGTNIKTINSTSLLGSGDISISASAGGSNTQIQFNDSGAFGADSLFNWDNTNKRLGVGETTPTARVHIKGEGATSGSSSLLLQNSSGTDLFKVRDDGRVFVDEYIYPADGTTNSRLRVSNSSGTYMYYSTGNLRLNPNLIYTSTTYGTVFTVKGNTGQFGLGTNNPDASALMEISSTTKGFLPPRMTTTQVEAIEATAGLIVYDLSTNTLKCYNGSSWNNLF